MFKIEKGITLIALVITIIILLILAGVAISLITGGEGLISKTSDAKVRTQASQLEEAINMHKLMNSIDNAEEMYPLLKNEEENYITLNEYNKNNLSESLKYELLALTTINAESTEIPTLNQLDYTKFIKLDESKVNIPSEWKDKLYMYISGGEYKVIHIECVKYEGKTIYIIAPFNNMKAPEYIAIANNTYKLYGDGTLKVVGEITANSGMTSEEDSKLNGWQEFNLEQINNKFGNKIVTNSNVETEDEYAKANGVKKIYFSCGTVYVIDANNDLWAWGDNTENKLGLGNSYLVTEPTKILEGRTEGTTGVKAKNVWAGATNTCIVDIENRIWVCGYNTTGTLGQGNTNYYSKWIQLNISGVTGDMVVKVYNRSKNNIMIALKNGKVYAAGYNGYGPFGNGTTTNSHVPIELTGVFTNSKTLDISGSTTYIIDQNGDLYACGYNQAGGLGVGDYINKKTPVLVKKDVKDVKVLGSYAAIFIAGDGKTYITGNGSYTQIQEIPITTSATFIGFNVLVNNNLYSSNGEIIFEGAGEKIESEFMSIAKKNGKVYTSYLDITKPKQKSLYSLRDVFASALLISGTGSNISVVTRNNELYDSLNVKNTEISNVKKVVVSNAARYILTRDGELYAKGAENTGLWGRLVEQTSYIKVTRNGTDYFNNIKDIFTSMDHTLIILTNDNKIYWAGRDRNILLPNIIPNNSGDVIDSAGNSKITYYPKEVTSVKLEEIKENIKDIKYMYNSSIGWVTEILTENGNIYVLSKNNINLSGTGKNENTDFVELTIKEGVKVKQIETLDGLSLALLENGEVYGWGYNTYGILGNGYEIGGIYPTPVKLQLNNISYMTLGTGFAIFASGTGQIYGIGKNDYGQLGTGNNTGASEFVRCPELEK